MAEKFTEKELNAITVQMLDYLSEAKIQSFQKLLKEYGVPDNLFSFGKLKDGAVCIMNDGVSWETFFYERREKINVRVFDNIHDACISAIEEISDEDSERNKMIDQFNQLQSDTKDDVSPSLLGKALKKALSSVAVF